MVVVIKIFRFSEFTRQLSGRKIAQAVSFYRDGVRVLRCDDMMVQDRADRDRADPLQ